MTPLLLRRAAATAALLAAAAVHAAPLVDTQAPANGLTGANVVDTHDWIAERFTLGAATLSQISVYVASLDPAADAGRTFTLAVYANTTRDLPALEFLAPDQNRLFATTLTFAGNGWTPADGLGWHLAAGSYWFALESDDGGPASLLAPTGTPVQAEAVAYYAGGRAYSSAGTGPADTFGLRVSAVPMPPSSLLMAAGLLTLGCVRRRGRAASGLAVPVVE